MLLALVVQMPGDSYAQQSQPMHREHPKAKGPAFLRGLEAVSV
jgi:hypothetical protein